MNLLKTQREALLAPLQAVTGIIERRHTLPILSNVLASKTDTQLEFVAKDNEIEITTSMTIEGPGEAKKLTVGARKLVDILRALPEGSEITLALQDKRLQVKSGKSRFNLQTLSAEDFPRLVLVEASATSLSVPQKLLKALLGLVQYAMAQQDIRYYFNGLIMVVEEGQLKLVATDGHRLAYASREVEGKNLPKQEVILPRKTIIELSKLLEDTDDSVAIELSSAQAKFKFGNVVLVSKLVDGKFPDYGRVIPQNHPKKLKLERIALLQALQRAAILTSDKFRGVRWFWATEVSKSVAAIPSRRRPRKSSMCRTKGRRSTSGSMSAISWTCSTISTLPRSSAAWAMPIRACCLPCLVGTISSTS